MSVLKCTWINVHVRFRKSLSAMLKLLIGITVFFPFWGCKLCTPSTNPSTNHEQGQLLKMYSDFPETGMAVYDYDSDTPCSGQCGFFFCDGDIWQLWVKWPSLGSWKREPFFLLFLATQVIKFTAECLNSEF